MSEERRSDGSGLMPGCWVAAAAAADDDNDLDRGGYRCSTSVKKKLREVHQCSVRWSAVQSITRDDDGSYVGIILGTRVCRF